MKINEAFKKYSFVPKRYEKRGKVNIVDTNLGRFVYKDFGVDNYILNYLKTRKFDYMPRIINDVFDNYRLFEYLEDFDIPKEQKILDMINLVSLLHSKTTHYKEVDTEYYEKIYDDLKNNIDFLYGYYNDLITIIDSKVYQSPSEYLLARNISFVFKSIDFCDQKLEHWHSLIYEKRKQRNVVLHNNLKLDHFIRNEKSYLISWDKAKIGCPVFDLYKLYRNHALDFDFSDIFNEYEKRYPLTTDEKELFFALISLPNIIEFNDTEYKMCAKISREIDTLYKTSDFIKKV